MPLNDNNKNSAIKILPFQTLLEELDSGAVLEHSQKKKIVWNLP